MDRTSQDSRRLAQSLAGNELDGSAEEGLGHSSYVVSEEFFLKEEGVSMSCTYLLISPLSTLRDSTPICQTNAIS